MADYLPLDLSTLCNAGLEVLNEKPNTPIGDQLFRGLPFRVNDDPANCFIASDKISDSVTIPINSSATGLILAHRLLESDLMEGGPLGIPVADYVFRMEGGEEIRVPIRERFEIAHISLGGKPFVALPDHGQVKMQRYEGHWSNMGRRQTEVTGDYSKGYFLWAWRNPHPDREVESLEVIPSGPPFIIAGVTLSQVNEHPFVRQGKREARLILTDPEDAEKPFDMSVGVDRGVASYVHPLPEASADDFVNDDFAGWGEAQNPKSSPAYVEVAAIPSATVTVKQGEDKVGEVRWGDVEQKKVVETPRMRIELLDRGRNWVHVNVLDDDTGRPVPCRVHFRSPEGIPYQPYGHHNQVNSNLDTWHIDIGGDLRLGPDNLRVHRRPMPGVAASRRGRRGRGTGIRVRAAPDPGEDRTGAAGIEPAPQALGEHERPRVVQRGFARPLPLDPGEPYGIPGRGPEHREPASLHSGAISSRTRRISQAGRVSPRTATTSST